MVKRGAWKILIAAVAAAPLLASAPASAQWFGDAVMPPQAIARIVMRNGFSGFSPPRLAGDVYIVHAIDEDGARVRLVIDAHDGRILRPVRSVEEFAPPRRLRPRDEAPPPEGEYDVEREPAGRFGTTRPGREALLPPRSIGREPWDALPRDADTDDDREPFGAPSVSREEPPAPAARNEPAPKRRSVRVEQPAREVAPAKPARPREAVRQAPAVTPAVPQPAVEAPKPDPTANATTTAAAPAPAASKETRPAAPAAPAAAIEMAKPEPSRPAETSQPRSAASQPAATASTSKAPSVRVIEGVTPILPQTSAPAEKDPSSEGPAAAQ